MTATARARNGKQPARRPASSAAQPPGPAGALDVIRISSDGVDDSRVPLFYIDGEEFTMLANPSASLALDYLDLAAADEAKAQVFMMTEMLGEDGWLALRKCRSLTAADLRRVVEIVNETLMGAMEIPKA